MNKSDRPFLVSCEENKKSSEGCETLTSNPCQSLRESFQYNLRNIAFAGALVGTAATAQACFPEFGEYTQTGGADGTGGTGASMETVTTTTGGMGGAGGSLDVGGAGGMGGSAGAGGNDVVADLSDDAGENECIHWLVSDAGTTVDFQDNTGQCLAKPLDSIPLATQQSLYMWSDHPASSNKVALTLQGVTATSFLTKCSAYNTPPDQTEMETDLLSGGYVAATNAAVPPDVELANAGCPDGASYVVNLQ